MIIKKRKKSLRPLGLERLLLRLPEHHPRFPNLENALRVTKAGENGEKILEDVFQKYQFPFEHYIFHDMNLRSNGQFQMDTLFLCRQGIVILEMKNIAGRISFPVDQNQLIRTLENGQVDSFECPSVQLDRNHMLLEDWFYARNLSVPIYKAVVFPRSKQLFENARPNLRILFPLEIPVYLRKVGKKPPILDAHQLKDIASALMESHREYNPFPLSLALNISSNELQTGIRCEKCGLFGMKSIHKGWGCSRCGYTDRHAHLQAMADYFMLINSRAANKDCRHFLRLDSHQKANRILKQLEVAAHGDKKSRFYEAGLEEIELLSRRGGV